MVNNKPHGFSKGKKYRWGISQIAFLNRFSEIVLQGLVELGHQQSLQNDIKSMASTWKHLSRLATEFHRVYRHLQQQSPSEFEPTSEDFLDWFRLCVQNICELITNNLNTMLKMVRTCILSINAYFHEILHNYPVFFISSLIFKQKPKASQKSPVSIWNFCKVWQKNTQMMSLEGKMNS